MTREQRAARKAAGTCVESDACERPLRPGTQRCEQHGRKMARRQARYNRKQYLLRTILGRCRRCGRDELISGALCRRCWKQIEALDQARRPPERKRYRCGRCGQLGHTAKGQRCPARFRPDVTIDELATARNAA